MNVTRVHIRIEHDTFNGDYALRVNGEVIDGREMTARNQVTVTGEFWVDCETLVAAMERQ